MDNFKKYADFYDKIYKEKNYQEEAEFVKKVIKDCSSVKVDDILSLGCGTASHDILLAKSGFKILGIDGSPEMIGIAEQKAKKENADVRFKIADISEFEISEKFDFAMAMFNVVGYMIENETMEKMLQSVSGSLKNEALFVFDCWYGPAVLKSRPEDREKIIGEGIIRKTKQKLEIEKSIVDIKFEIMESGVVKAEENHKMRFWYLQELKYFLENNNFRLVKACNFLALDSNISEDNWNIFIVARKQ